MNQSKRTILLAAILLFILNSVYAQLNSKVIRTLEGGKIQTAELEAGIENIMDSIEMPGLSIAIINDSEIVYHHVFGVANNKTMEPLDTNSIFEGASLSKPLFAYFVLKEAEDGIIDLDKPLFEYLPHPGIAEASLEDYKLITARMVLSHSSGFPNHSEGKAIQLAFKPGTGFQYSGEAYQYLAAIIGQLHGVGWKKEFNRIFESKTTQPLKMTHTSYLWNDYLAEHKVYGHKDNIPTHNDTGGWSGETFNAFSSIHSNAQEYAKFIVAMLKYEGLSEQMFQEMLKEQTHFKDDNHLKLEVGQTGWGLGFAQKPTDYGLMHLHTGNNHDFQSYAMFVPQQKYGLVVFTNSDKMPVFLEKLQNLIGQQF